MDSEGRQPALRLIHRYIHYLVWSYAERYGVGLSRYKILILLFLADLESLKRRKSRLLAIDWYKLFRIPYSLEVDNAVRFLLTRGYIKCERGGSLYLPVMRPVGIAPETARLIDEIIGKYGSLSVTELCQIVSKLAPFERAKLGDKIEL